MSFEDKKEAYLKAMEQHEHDRVTLSVQAVDLIVLAMALTYGLIMGEVDRDLEMHTHELLLHVKGMLTAIDPALTTFMPAIFFSEAEMERIQRILQVLKSGGQEEA